MLRKLKNPFILLLIASLFSSCFNKSLILMVNDDDSDNRKEFIINRDAKTIEPKDKLYIKVYSIDESISNIFQDRGTGLRDDLNLLSYTVDDAGEITFPFVGKIKVSGLTIDEARKFIEDSLKQYLSKISVVVRYMGNKITVLGEVNYSGEFFFYDERINIFQAIGLAGGFNMYGNRADVKVVREDNKVVNFYALDLTKKNIVESDNYYLQPNDIVIVNPIKVQFRNYRDFGLYNLIFASVSSMLLVISYIDSRR